ncbi:ig-like domain-containing protein [Trichonephila clavata]|uniref:Ig-like domain-containing protein n=1 Tax=Trichonephila clavata TaxID=2740835 RepID=A0A8X6HD92_TRICU|nr:ig-like domain-containing protein [Trichonephila clavata]
MEAVAGGRLSLPCDITSPIVDDEVYLVLWYKDEVATPIYSLDARRGPLGRRDMLPTNHSQEGPISVRFHNRQCFRLIGCPWRMKACIDAEWILGRPGHNTRLLSFPSPVSFYIVIYFLNTKRVM